MRARSRSSHLGSGYSGACLIRGVEPGFFWILRRRWGGSVTQSMPTEGVVPLAPAFEAVGHRTGVLFEGSFP